MASSKAHKCELLDHVHSEEPTHSSKRVRVVSISEGTSAVPDPSRMKPGKPSREVHKIRLREGNQNSSFAVSDDDDGDGRKPIRARVKLSSYGYRQRRKRFFLACIKNSRHQIKPRFFPIYQSETGKNKLRPLPRPPKLPNVPAGYAFG